jgi:FkbM family methyltransferase
MHPRLRSGIDTVKRSTRSSLVRIGKEEQAKEVVGRVREMRLTLDADWQRERRDEHALNVVLATALRAESNAVDVGANVGAVLEAIVRVAPGGRHIAYEPIPELHEALAARFPGVDVRRAALSDVAETTTFAHVVDAPAYSGLKQRELPPDSGEVAQIPVRTERLDDVIEDGYVPALLKIDVEGAELNVLRGALRTLQQHRPFVLFEHGAGGADVYGATPGEVFDLLSDARLRIFDMEGDGPYSRDRFEATFTEPIWNFLAAPA